MDQMFYNCKSLTSFDFGMNFETTNALNLKEMFYGSSALKNINLRNEFTVSNTEKLFYKCSSLNKINLQAFISTENAESIEEMFFYWNQLTSIDISTFTTSLTSINLFNQLPSKGTIKVKESFLSLIESQMSSGWTISKS